MFKKTFILLATMVALVWAQVDWSANNITITTEAELRELAQWVEYGHDFSGKVIALGADIELTSEWKPIGNEKNKFRGTFDGSGKSISNISVSGVQYAGLFGYVDRGGQIKNLIVNVANITTKARYETYAGGLVGYYASENTIENCGVNVKNSVYANYSGGLAGYTKGTITIINSYAIGDVFGKRRGPTDSFYSGGLVGYSHSEILRQSNESYYLNEIVIINSHATGNVSNGMDKYDRGALGSLGGLIGYGNVTITDSYATGDVSGYLSGGLVGSGPAAIINSYATGNVSGSSWSGGLVGDGKARIINSYATGNVSGENTSGGLVGSGTATITNSYVTGNVSGEKSGGLVGSGTATITNSYVTGNVFGKKFSGGLVGSLLGTSGTAIITNCYATGSVSGNNIVGGLVGENGGKIQNSYVLSGAANMIVGNNEGGTISMTSGFRGDGQMKEKSTYKDWDFVEAWEINSNENNGFPYLYDVGNIAKTREGKYETYYENGNLWKTANFKNGKLDGKSEIYYENGKLVETRDYKDGRLIDVEYHIKFVETKKREEKKSEKSRTKQGAGRKPRGKGQR
ncbi:MAG: hypothetical protein FWC15_03770 [Fibromonadales bacterium]|nr:hypothetical protein [Fibromonadales bacterium]